MSTLAIKNGQWPGMIGTFMGRDALALAVHALALSPADTVLLPAYLCNEVVKPFLGRCNVEFYRLGPNLTLDIEALAARLKRTKVRALVMINYFGFLDPRRQELKALCTATGTKLIEDCALSLLTEGSGETGDMVIYSHRKTLPIPDGGGLKLNGDWPVKLPAFHPQIYSNVLSFCIMVKRRLNLRSESLSRAGLSAPPPASEQKNLPAPKIAKILPMSSFARRGIARSDFQPIIDNQRKDFLFWRDLVRRSSRLVPIYPDLPNGVCPLGFPIKMEGRDKFRSQLAQRGVFLRVHWRVPPAVGSGFPESHALSAEMITLPIYPELTPEVKTEIVRALDLA